MQAAAGKTILLPAHGIRYNQGMLESLITAQITRACTLLLTVLIVSAIDYIGATSVMAAPVPQAPAAADKAAVDAKKESTVTLVFPKNRSLGRLYKLDMRFPAGPRRLTPSMDARGNITIPASCKIQLAVSYEGATDLSPLKNIKADNIFMIDAGHVDNFNDRCLESISALKSVKSLVVDDTDITDKGMHSICSMSQLIALSMQQLTIKDAALNELQNLKNLQRLRLDYIRLTHESAKNLRTLVDLGYLNISYCSIDDEMMQNLKSLKKLQTLHLADNKQVTDRGIQCLVGLPQLFDLDAQRVSLTPGCAKYLKQIKSLRQLSVSLAAPDFQTLAKQLPDCKLTNNAAPNIPVEVFAPLK